MGVAGQVGRAGTLVSTRRNVRGMGQLGADASIPVALHVLDGQLFTANNGRLVQARP